MQTSFSQLNRIIYAYLQGNMKIKHIAGFFLLSMALNGHAQTPSPYSAQQLYYKKQLCLFTALPPPENSYIALRNLKFAKNSYGSVNNVLPLLVAEAQSLGADAVINYNGSQRFGFWPWRFVRPVVRGTAIRWSSPRTLNCTAMGGTPTNGMLDAAPKLVSPEPN